MKYFIYQGNNHDCGFAALKMMMANTMKNKSYLYIPKPIKKEKYSIGELIDIAKDYGFEISAYGCTEDYFLNLKENSVALINGNHAVMIKKVYRNKIKIYDPELGIRVLSKKEFLSCFEYKMLEVDSTENVKEIEKIRREILPKKLKIFEAIVAFISSVILIGTFYLLNNVTNSIFSLLFLAIFATSEILENYIIYKEFYHFDKKFIKPYFSFTRNQNELSYMDFISFKENYFVHNRSTLRSTLLAFTITFLLCLNDFRNILVLLVLILVKLLDLTLFSKGEDNVRGEIQKEENLVFKDTNKCVEHALKANSLSSTLVCSKSMKQVFYMVLAFGFALIMMLLTNNSGCNYVIFHFVLYYFGFNSFSDVIYSFNNRKEIKKQESRFFDCCNL